MRYASGHTDTQTNKPTDTFIALLRSHAGGEVVSYFGIQTDSDALEDNKVLVRALALEHSKDW